ncbi:MAG: bifunctional glutamate N-acetyltransferase/amino-acid acetyltransferase ArgJ [Deltaproteobacteria bacterium]|nr:bifunctional glutamate N-acetyltransferase/amino-acid acetyltransferase ArgJ [Deltaproteobacteria bacterium]NND30527.1 bifunctional glutamate N-acetyltransferase/amino-acid acetyltransferase ArgJ [Myxococcales bacterium]MBT8465655.1 bifunctional glutamate N-acetyltransferase/amino-acid acetyltransferase ArgJ [Deltaproteobacteria bacterium]MBT8480549.1 bifunctional glutamate N-acetyltransferase/amino-acid acetyltransferase ArgJ [Deltaproteobacteria bacterium]NNK09278.1 bifunctional glutamate 
MSGRVKGFRFAGVHGGVKAGGALDFGLIFADEPAVASAVFTRNRVRAAPVKISERRLKSGRCQAVLVNSGNANACTGKQGHQAALALTRTVARSLRVPSSLVVPASTGVIGVQLPRETLEIAVPDLVDDLSQAGASRFARSILTTDRGPKVAQAEVQVGRTRCRLLGIAKGAGMIHPNMATTLAFVTTDAPLGRSTLSKLLRQATELSFNRATVDGDTSTNDSIYVLASGAATGRTVEEKSASGRRLLGALTEVLESLAKKIVADGEGAEHLVRIEVRGARTNADALQIARTIACSQLVKTALHGCDPNWGRIVAAAGRSGARFNPDHVSVQIGPVSIFREGTPRMTAKTEAKAAATMKRKEYQISVIVGSGPGIGHYWTCDLGHEYVRINADYRT